MDGSSDESPKNHFNIKGPPLEVLAGEFRKNLSTSKQIQVHGLGFFPDLKRISVRLS